MKIGTCRRPLLEPCELEGFSYQLDPYIGCEHLCYYCYALNNATTDWSAEILVHEDFISRLEHEIANLKPQRIYMGWNSDPYQPVEAHRLETRHALEVLKSHGFSVCILTKSDLVARDIDLLKAMEGASAGISLAFQDESVRKLFESKAPPNEQRLAGLKQLKAAGISTYALICPVIPFITDVDRLVKQVEPWADSIWVYPLEMKSENDRNWQNTRAILEQHFPHLTEDIKRIVFTPRGRS